MKNLLSLRLRSHRLVAPARSVAEAASHMLAVQSQDFTAGRWALAVRTRGEPSLSAVDRAFDRGEIVRAWTMRGTLHTIAARDLGWVLDVTAARQVQQAASRHRELGIDDGMLAAVKKALVPALADGGRTRAEVFEILSGIGIDPSGQRGIHLLFALTVDGTVCQGSVVQREGIAREQHFVLVEEHIRERATPDDPLAELFVRYIDGHGPASVADFAWWSGLTLGQSREAAGRAQSRVRQVDDDAFTALVMPRRTVDDDLVHALPAFDEYYLSYADRTTVCASEALPLVGPGNNGMVRPTLVANGRVIGVWSHAGTAARSSTQLFDDTVQAEPVDAAIQQFRRFISG